MTNDSPAAARVASIDILRGVVILLMMLDHVRERFYMHTRTGDPMFDSIDADLYFTRYLTHLCAPVFIFLAGLSAWLYAHAAEGQYRSPSEFLFKRGMVIILIELVLYYLVWADSYPSFLFLQVLWAIGLCMIGLSLACRLPYWLIGAAGLLIVFGYGTLGSPDFEPGGVGHVLWTILLEPDDLGQVGGLTINVSYPRAAVVRGHSARLLCRPLVCSVNKFSDPIASTNRPGRGVLALMLTLRGFNLYGEALPWSAQATAAKTIMSFLNFTKYPPSLDFLLITLGTGFLLLAWLESIRGETSCWARCRISVRYLCSSTSYICMFCSAAYWLLFLVFGPTHGERFGLSGVGWIWVGTIALALAHYPIASAFAAYKHREKRNKPWLSYF